jgi:hypothetical protein
VAAALKAPGLRYRSFGNEPVRTPRVDVSNVTETYPLLGAAMEAAADDLASPEPEAPSQLEPMPEPPVAEAAPVIIPAPPPVPEPVYIAPPAEPAYAPPPAYTPPPLFAQALSQPMPPPPMPAAAPAAPAAAPAYSLLEALGRQADLGPSMSASASMPATGYGQAPIGPAPGGTFGNLLAGSAGAPGGYGAPAGPWGSSPGTALRSASLLPAAAVTVPLSEVLRLVAVGAPAPSSPFDAFRAAVRAPGSR